MESVSGEESFDADVDPALSDPPPGTRFCAVAQTVRLATTKKTMVSRADAFAKDGDRSSILVNKGCWV
jgi:hypothetical protein